MERGQITRYSGNVMLSGPLPLAEIFFSLGATIRRKTASMANPPLGDSDTLQGVYEWAGAAFEDLAEAMGAPEKSLVKNAQTFLKFF
jgi:hypothetical protein